MTNTEGRQEKATGMKCEAGRERERLGCWLDSEEVWVSDWMRASGARLRAGLCAQVGIRLQAAMTGLRGQEDKVRDQGLAPRIRSLERFHLWFKWWQWQPRATANVPTKVGWEFVCGL